MLPYSSITVAQVVTAYEISGLNEFMIADQLDIPEDDIRIILLRDSSLYQDRHNLVKPGSLMAGVDAAADKDSLEYRQFRSQYEAMLKVTDNDIVREKGLKYLMDEAKGRNDLAAAHLKLKQQQVQKSATQEERLAKFKAMLETLKPKPHQLSDSEQLKVVA